MHLEMYLPSLTHVLQRTVPILEYPAFCVSLQLPQDPLSLSSWRPLTVSAPRNKSHPSMSICLRAPCLGSPQPQPLPGASLMLPSSVHQYRPRTLYPLQVVFAPSQQLLPCASQCLEDQAGKLRGWAQDCPRMLKAVHESHGRA